MTLLEIAVPPVFEHIHHVFRNTARRVAIVEVGQHDGWHSALFRICCSCPPLFIGIEPDPRNVKMLRDSGWNPEPCAASDRPGMAILYMSNGTTPEGVSGWNASSSIQKPTDHLRVYPWCTFDKTAPVQTDTLDNMTHKIREESGCIDLIWCDVQGAQRKVLAGATATLAVTRYLYIECHPTPLYEGEPTFEELVKLLPDGWRVVQRYDSDVLLENMEMG